MPSTTEAAITAASRDLQQADNASGFALGFVPARPVAASTPRRGAVLTTPAAALEQSLPASGLAIGFTPADPVAASTPSTTAAAHEQSPPGSGLAIGFTPEELVSASTSIPRAVLSTRVDDCSSVDDGSLYSKKQKEFKQKDKRNSGVQVVYFRGAQNPNLSRPYSLNVASECVLPVCSLSGSNIWVLMLDVM